MTADPFDLEATRYGFRWGPATVERTFSDPKVGVVLTIATPYGEAQVAVSPTGRTIRTFVRRRDRAERRRRRAGGEA